MHTVDMKHYRVAYACCSLDITFVFAWISVVTEMNGPTTMPVCNADRLVYISASLDSEDLCSNQI